MSDVRTASLMNVKQGILLTFKGFNKMAPFWMCRKWSIFFLISSTLLYVTLSSVKGFKKTMASSLAESNRRMMVRSSPKLFWNGVPDRIISFLVRSSARAFRISLFGRPLLKFVPKSELFYPELRSKTILKSFVASFLANDEAMDFFNTLTDNVTYRRTYI